MARSSCCDSAPNAQFNHPLALRSRVSPASGVFKKTCTGCGKLFGSHVDICESCYTAAIIRNLTSHVAHCPRCQRITLHLGDGVCIECRAVKAQGTFPLFCSDCDGIEPLPHMVIYTGGILVDLLDNVDTLYCITCGAVADSYMRIPAV